MPALVVKSSHSVASFLLAYCVGTVLMMSTTAAIVAESTRKLGKAVRSNDLTKNLTLGSSILALAVGALWIWKAIF